MCLSPAALSVRASWGQGWGLGRYYKVLILACEQGSARQSWSEVGHTGPLGSNLCSLEHPLLCDLLGHGVRGKPPFFFHSLQSPLLFPNTIFEDHNIYHEPYYERLFRV